MEISWLLSLLGFLWVAAVTPVPNNMLLTSAAANFGFRRSVPVLTGIILGMQILLLLVALGIGGLLTLFPSVYLALKVLGSLYLFWIAWKIATSSYERLNADKEMRPVTLYQAGLLQFLNPKAWLMVLGAVSSFSLIDDYTASIWIIGAVLLTVNFVAGVIWAGFGTVIGRMLRSRDAWFIFNISMGLLTAVCVVFIWI